MSLSVHTNDPRFGDKLINDYIDVFGSYSFKNKLYAKISLHVLLGQCISKPDIENENGNDVVKKIPVYYQIGSRRTDTRIHMLLIKPQGTGKGAGYGFVVRMANFLGLDFESLTEATDAGLVGTLDKDEDGNRIVVDGLLKSCDMVGMEEASVLFDLTSDFSKKNMTYMQIAMNDLEDASCYITKKLGPEKIGFKPHGSLILLTYPPDKLVDKLLKTGFMDRIICIFEDVTLADRLEVIREMSQNFNKLSKIEYDKNFNDVAERLKTLIRYWTETNVETCIEIPSDVDKILIKVVEEFALKILDASPKAREKLEHFISRLYGILIKLSVHHAILSFRSKLDVSDVMYARLTYLPIWRNLIISIESLLIISDVERNRRFMIEKQAVDEYDKILKENKKPHVKNKIWVRRLTMIERLQGKWDHCSKETADNNLRKLEKLPKSEYEHFSEIKDAEKDKFFVKKNIGGIPYLKKVRSIVY